MTAREVDGEVLQDESNTPGRASARSISPTTYGTPLGFLPRGSVPERRHGSETISATLRKLKAGSRFSAAFARLWLAEEISMDNAEMAIDLIRTLIGQIFNPDTGEFNAYRMTEAAEKTQLQRETTVQDAIQSLAQDHDDGTPRKRF